MSLVIFDFDGVLANTFADMIQFAQEACDELGVQHSVTPANLRDLEVMSFMTFGRACGVPENLAGEFVNICTAKFAKKKSPLEIFDGLPDIIRKLSKDNILVIVTGNTTENVNVFLAHHNLQDCFHMVYGVDMPGSKAGKISAARRQFDAEDEPAFFVGDSLSDIQAAREANIGSIAVGWGHQRFELLIRGGPDFIVHSPVELLEVLRGPVY